MKRIPRHWCSGPCVTAPIAILAGPNGDGKAAVVARQKRYQAAGRAVAPLAGGCDAGFSVVITPATAFIVAAEGG